MSQFPTNYNQIIERIHQIDAKQYEKTRNYLSGAVTYLSPYISRGVVSLPQIKDIVVPKFGRYISEKLVQELAWREFFQRVWQHQGDKIFTDLKHPQSNVLHHEVPSQLMKASTGIEGIDQSIQTMYSTGYMHNHARMYTAMLTCNIAKAHWLAPSKWLYYHLLDGDLASNMLSWQWVAGSFSSKQYFANQTNINQYTGSQQRNTYLDCTYEALPDIAVPNELKCIEPFTLTTILPRTNPPIIDSQLPIYVYNSYNLDPNWHKDQTGNRVLLLEPSHFTAYPISQKVLQFILDLATQNIPNIQIFVAEFDALKALAPSANFVFKEHPLNTHYTGTQESRHWLFPEVHQFFGSFFSYWKKCERYYQ